MTGRVRAISARIETPMQSDQVTRARIGPGLNHVLQSVAQIGAGVFRDVSGGGSGGRAQGAALAHDWRS